jgi:uncharacterized Tic20 family protein
METQPKKTPQHLHFECIDSIFYSFGNYIFQYYFGLQKDKSEFVDHNGKQVLNFQLGLLLYSLVLI